MKGKTILILSPQPWHHLFVSKHHYAKALAESNTVYFISAPTYGFFTNFRIENVLEGLSELSYSIPVFGWIKFKLPTLYRKYIRYKLKQLLDKKIGMIDWCVDFGCYQQYNSMDFVAAKRKIFFPVDDFENLPIHPRGSDLIVTVSRNIQNKFSKGTCYFINHGLASEFAQNARVALVEGKAWYRSTKVRVGYAGNLFLRFLDTKIFAQIILSNPQIEFHLFGNREWNKDNEDHKEWNSVLEKSNNVIIHGLLTTESLVKEYNKMDAFILCYKPDNKNYHGENSHKIMEYLSTGKVTVASHISAYENSDLLVMPDSQNNTVMPALFQNVIRNLDEFNSIKRMNVRRTFALDNTYSKQIERIEALLA